MEIRYSLLINSILIGVVLNIFFQWVFIKLNKFDPVNQRSSHNTLATKTGGIALFTSLFLITLYFYFTSNEIFDFSLLIPLAIIFIIGVYDDFYDANFKLKFFIQIIVAKLFIDQGLIINNFHGLFGLYEISNVFAQITTIFTFLVIVNAINFSDGIDGLAASLVIYFILVLEFLMDFNSKLINLNMLSIVLLIPFYYFNSNKINKVFLGDAGSLLLGSIVAINIFNFLSNQNINIVFYNPAIISFTLLIYPLIDLLRVFIIRIRQGKSPFFADNNHLHHKLSNILKNHYNRTFFIIFSSLLILSFVLLIEYYFNSIYTISLLLFVSIISFFKS